MAKLMPALIDSSLWIDFTRARSPRPLKQFIATHILSPHAVLAEPIAYEVLRFATDEETRLLRAQFRLMPLLPTPDDLWDRAATLGQHCRKTGISPGSLDLLIAQVAIHHDAELITFDADFEAIAKASDLRVKLLHWPTP
jgi:predicted nucleic acid-binding protein